MGEVDRALATARGGKPARLRTFRTRAGRSPEWWDTTIVRVAGGAALLAASRNITADIESRSLLETIVDHAPAVLFAKDASDDALHHGQPGRRGLLPQVARGNGRPDAGGSVRRGGGRLHHRVDHEVATTGRVFVQEKAHQTESSGERIFKTRVMATFGDEGPRHIIGVCEDVTDRARNGRGPDARPRRGRGRQPGQERIPRQHEPRDPHAAERRAWAWPTCWPRTELDAASSARWCEHDRARRARPWSGCCPTSSTWRRSRPAARHRDRAVRPGRRWSATTGGLSPGRAPTRRAWRCDVELAPEAGRPGAAATSCGCARSCSTCSATRVKFTDARRGAPASPCRRRRGRPHWSAGRARHRRRLRPGPTRSGCSAASSRPTARSPAASAARAWAWPSRASWPS